jgi:hypothetical protein
MEALKRWFPDEIERHSFIKNIKEMYSGKMHGLHIWCGPGNSGKTTVQRLLETIFKERCFVIHPDFVYRAGFPKKRINNSWKNFIDKNKNQIAFIEDEDPCDNRLNALLRLANIYPSLSLIWIIPSEKEFILPETNVLRFQTIFNKSDRISDLNTLVDEMKLI